MGTSELHEGSRYKALTIILERDDGQWASYCRELGTASCGDTMDEARANVIEAISVHLETLRDMGNRRG